VPTVGHAGRVACCKRMQAQLHLACPEHEDLSRCPDSLVARWPGGEYGLRVHDGGSAVVKIEYCPWCGTRLPGPSRP
jgi:hypothetical protein